jgi:hypothetical protein
MSVFKNFCCTYLPLSKSLSASGERLKNGVRLRIAPLSPVSEATGKGVGG